jgi:hypothetical protein
MEVEMPYRPLIVLMALLWVSSTCLSAGVVHFPLQKSKTAEALETAGIASYQLSRDGEEVHVEAFGSSGEVLATCNAHWPPDCSVLTCTMPDGGLYEAKWYAKRAEFRDLQSGDHLSLHVEPISDPTKIEHPSLTGEWILEGTKSWQEAEKDWGHITPIFSHLIAEVQLTLGIRQANSPALEEDPAVKQQRFE